MAGKYEYEVLAPTPVKVVADEVLISDALRFVVYNEDGTKETVAYFVAYAGFRKLNTLSGVRKVA